MDTQLTEKQREDLAIVASVDANLAQRLQDDILGPDGDKAYDAKYVLPYYAGEIRATGTYDSLNASYWWQAAEDERTLSVGERGYGN